LIYREVQNGVDHKRDEWTDRQMDRQSEQTLVIAQSNDTH